MLQSEVRAASLAACLDDVGAAVLQALTVGASDVSVTASVTSAIATFQERQLSLLQNEDEEIIYDACPDELIDLPSAAQKYDILKVRLHRWIKTGHLRSMGRLRDSAPGGGRLLVAIKDVEKLKDCPPKRGRPFAK